MGTGSSASCPAGETLPDSTPCNDGSNVCDHGVCNGICNNISPISPHMYLYYSQVLHVFSITLQSVTALMKTRYYIHDRTHIVYVHTLSIQLCEVCCLFDGSCISTFDWDDAKNITVQPGYPCRNFTGYCTEDL